MVNNMHRAEGKGYLNGHAPHGPNLPTEALATAQNGISARSANISRRSFCLYYILSKDDKLQTHIMGMEIVFDLWKNNLT